MSNETIQLNVIALRDGQKKLEELRVKRELGEERDKKVKAVGQHLCSKASVQLSDMVVFMTNLNSKKYFRFKLRLEAEHFQIKN